MYYNNIGSIIYYNMYYHNIGSIIYYNMYYNNIGIIIYYNMYYNNIGSIISKLILSLVHSYTIDRGVAYLTLTTGGFSKRISFAFLENIAGEFHSRYGNRIKTASRPYAFLEFGFININYFY